MKFKAVFFDLDGTLVDSIPLHASSFHELLRELGLEMPLEELVPMIGQTSQQMFEEFNKRKPLGVSLEKFFEMRRTYFKKAIGEKDITFSPVFGVLSELKGKIPLALVTNSSHKTTFKITTNERLRSFFDVIVTAGDVKKPKPNPEPFELAAKKLGVPLKECVLVGDAVQDAEGAKNAGIPFIAVTTGIASKEELEKFRPFALIESLEGLIPLLL